MKNNFNKIALVGVAAIAAFTLLKKKSNGEPGEGGDLSIEVYNEQGQRIATSFGGIGAIPISAQEGETVSVVLNAQNASWKGVVDSDFFEYVPADLTIKFVAVANVNLIPNGIQEQIFSFGKLETKRIDSTMWPSLSFRIPIGAGTRANLAVSLRDPNGIALKEVSASFNIASAQVNYRGDISFG